MWPVPNSLQYFIIKLFRYNKDTCFSEFSNILTGFFINNFPGFLGNADK